MATLVIVGNQQVVLAVQGHVYLPVKPQALGTGSCMSLPGGERHSSAAAVNN